MQKAHLIRQLMHREGVQLVDKLSEQIDFVYRSYGDVMDETNNIHKLNEIGLESVKILREKI